MQIMNYALIFVAATSFMGFRLGADSGARLAEAPAVAADAVAFEHERAIAAAADVFPGEDPAIPPAAMSGITHSWARSGDRILVGTMVSTASLPPGSGGERYRSRIRSAAAGAWEGSLTGEFREAAFVPDDGSERVRLHTPGVRQGAFGVLTSVEPRR